MPRTVGSIDRRVAKNLQFPAKTIILDEALHLT